MTYQFADVNGTKIHYEERGKGTAVIFIHAGVVNSGMWNEQMASLGQRYRVIRYDIRGWGETADPAVVYSDHEDLYGLLTYLGVETAVLIGCSMGGKIALDFALTYPQMIAGLVLVGAGLGGYDFSMEGILERAEAMNAAYERGELDLAVEISTQVWYDGLNRSPDQVDAYGRSQIRQLIYHTFCLPEGSGKRQELSPPAINRLAGITAPTLIVVGDHDAPDIQRIADLLQDNLRHARKKTLADTAHFPNAEKPTEFNQIVLEFLAGETSEA
ncbi:MAG: alpha/beta hydrolase [Anaerolineales bacterium]|nr:alpha/beta hydrolase [Anaerolineales bacterium]